jgi:hypothetical protein
MVRGAEADAAQFVSFANDHVSAASSLANTFCGPALRRAALVIANALVDCELSMICNRPWAPASFAL